MFGISLGALFLVHPWRRPWSVVAAWVVFWVSGGYLIARFIGIAIEGPSSSRQWIFVAVEAVICAIATLWIRHRRDTPDRS